MKKTKKYFCLRFDIDTHACLTKGMPNLLLISNELDIKFTFFVNMGRGFDRLNSIKNIVNRVNTKNDALPKSLSMFSKLGKIETIIAMVLNPLVGANHKNILQKAMINGHELGLHGGKNHSHWEKCAHKWSSAKIRSEITYGLAKFEAAGLKKPSSFASPAWNTPPYLRDILYSLDFTICADTRDELADGATTVNGLIEAPTNILSPNSEVGYIENLRALGFSDTEILSRFRNQLESTANLAIMYEHPFYAGVHELSLLRKMINIAKDLEFSLETIKSAVSSQQNNHEKIKTI